MFSPRLTLEAPQGPQRPDFAPLFSTGSSPVLNPSSLSPQSEEEGRYPFSSSSCPQRCLHSIADAHTEKIRRDWRALKTRCLKEAKDLIQSAHRCNIHRRKEGRVGFLSGSGEDGGGYRNGRRQMGKKSENRFIDNKIRRKLKSKAQSRHCYAAQTAKPSMKNV